MTDITNRLTPRIAPFLVAAGALAVVALRILMARTHQDEPDPLAVASLSRAPSGVNSADYVGSHWRLTAVTDPQGTTEIPSSIDAWLGLAADGELTASDGINAISGHFTTTSAGFDVYEVAITLVGYVGKDPARLAARTGISAMIMDEEPRHVTVVSADREHLNVQAGGVRLTFVRNGVART